MSEDNRKSKTGLIVGIAAGIVTLALVGTLAFFAFGRGDGGGSSASKRANTLALAREYVERGEFQRALDLLDTLLIEDSTDADARALRDQAISAKRGAEGDKSAQEEATRRSEQESVSSALNQIGKAVESVSKVAESSPKVAAAAAEKAAEAAAKAAAFAKWRSMMKTPIAVRMRPPRIAPPPSTSMP